MAILLNLVKYALCFFFKKNRIILLAIVGRIKHCENVSTCTKPSFVSLGSPNNRRCGGMGIGDCTGKGVLLAPCVVLIIYAMGQHRRRKRHDATPSTFLKHLAALLDAFGDVSELSLALQSESTTLSKAIKLVKRCIRAFSPDA